MRRFLKNVTEILFYGLIGLSVYNGAKFIIFTDFHPETLFGLLTVILGVSMILIIFGLIVVLTGLTSATLLLYIYKKNKLSFFSKKSLVKPCNLDHNGECLVCDNWINNCAYDRWKKKDYSVESKEELDQMFKNE